MGPGIRFRLYVKKAEARVIWEVDVFTSLRNLGPVAQRTGAKIFQESVNSASRWLVGRIVPLGIVFDILDKHGKDVQQIGKRILDIAHHHQNHREGVIRLERIRHGNVLAYLIGIVDDKTAFL